MGLMACKVDTKRLRLVPLGPGHISDTYVGWLNDPALMRFSKHSGRMHTEASCRDYAANFDHVSCCLWAIEIYSGTHIGNVNAYITQDQGLADIGLLVGHGAGGQGYGLEAWQGALAALFEHYKLRKVTGGCLAPHHAMRRIMECSGMVPDGLRQNHFLHNDNPVDVIHMAIFSNQYVKAPTITLKSVPAPAWG
jgi:[ribosomal protein S5]-alanine N-acetyltransferase